MKKSVISILIVSCLVAAVVFAICLKKNKNGNTSGTTFVTTDNSEEQHTEQGEYIRIDAVDGSYHIGTRMLLKFTASSDELAEGVVWKTSDSNIVTVSNSGEAEVVGEGTAIITITSGIYSDSMVVQGITVDKETEVFETDAPESPTEPDTDRPTVKPTEPVTDRPVDRPTEPVTDRPVDKPTEPVTVKPTEPVTDGPTVKPTEPVTEKPTEPVTEKPTEPATEKPTAKPTEPTTAKPDYKLMLLETLPAIGYTRHLETVYLYKEDGNYLGEVIVNDDSVQIYVQTRTTGFDAALKELLKVVLPKEYNNVFAVFVQSDTNKTIVAEGHTIRIRPSEDENHAQLIISY